METRELTAAEESDLRVEMRRGEGIALEARDGIFATPLRGLFVRAIDGSGQAAFAGSVSLDSEGRGEVPSLKPGVYEVRAESSGYAPVSLPGVAVPSRTVTLTLTPGGSLEIRVGEQTLALPQPTARLLGADGRVYMWNAFTTDGKIRLTAPVRRFENVAPGRYTLEVEGGVRRDGDDHGGGPRDDLVAVSASVREGRAAAGPVRAAQVDEGQVGGRGRAVRQAHAAGERVGERLPGERRCGRAHDAAVREPQQGAGRIGAERVDEQLQQHGVVARARPLQHRGEGVRRRDACRGGRACRSPRRCARSGRTGRGRRRRSASRWCCRTASTRRILASWKPFCRSSRRAPAAACRSNETATPSAAAAPAA